MMTPAMLLDLLPKPVIALLAAGFFGCRPFFLRCYGTGTGYPDLT